MASPEVAQVDAARRGRAAVGGSEQAPGDEPPGDHEEYVDAEIAAGEPPEVEQHYRTHGDGAQTIEPRPVCAIGATRVAQ